MNTREQEQFEELESQLGVMPEGSEQDSSESEGIVVSDYPEDRDESEMDESDEEVEELVEAALAQNARPATEQGSPSGYVSNARNAASRSDSFTFWASAEELTLGIGTLVRHTAPDPTKPVQEVNSYGIITQTEGQTLGLDDFATHAYESDTRPPLASIQPVASRRYPVVNYVAKVISSEHKVQRPVLSGPVYPVEAAELLQVHGKKPADETDGEEEAGGAEEAADWPGAEHMLLGFYEDPSGSFGIFAEERARVLGPKQGHVVLSGLPGAGKTSLFQAMVIALYAQLRRLEGEENDEQ